MLANSSIKVFHKILISGLVVVLCLVFLENFYNHKITYGDEKRLIHAAAGHKVSTGESGGSVLTAAGGHLPATVDDGNHEVAEAAAIVLWWTPFIDEMEYTKNCGNSVCFFTGNRQYFDHEKLKARQAGIYSVS